MITLSEAYTPTAESVALIRGVVDETRKASPELPSWFDYFVSVHLHRIAFDIDLVRRDAPAGARVLDVGALPLMLTGGLARMGFDVAGLDIAPERMGAAIAALNLEVLKCNVETDHLPFSDQNFDVIVFNEVFEHLRINLIDSVGELLRVTAVGGRLFLSTPNHLSLMNVRRMIGNGRSMGTGVYDEYQKLKTFGGMGHVREYTSGDVIDFLSRMGFRVDKLIYRGRYGTNLSQAIVRLKPSLRPYFSVVATRVS